MTAVPAKEVTTKQVATVRFGFYTDEEVRKLSVKRIVQPIIFDNLKNPVPGGLYDPALGPLEMHGRCATCGLSYHACPGHFGHIELPVPVYNPLIFGTMYKLLRQQCHCCFQFRMDREEIARFELKLALLASGRLVEAAALNVNQSELPKDLAAVVEDLGSGRGESQQERYPHRGAGATPVMSSHVLEAIQDAVADFFARMPKQRCKNCEAWSPNIKKMGATRIFKVWPSAKALLGNRKLGKSCVGVLETKQSNNEKAIEAVEEQMARQLDEEKARRRAAAKKGAAERKRLRQGADQKDDVQKRAKKEENPYGGLEDDDDEDDDKEEDEEGVMQYVPSGLETKAMRIKGKKGEDDDEDEQMRDGGQGGMGSPGTEGLTTTMVQDSELRPKYMSPAETHELLRRLWEREWRILSLIFGPGGATLLGGKRGAALEGRKAEVPGMRIVDHYRGGPHPGSKGYGLYTGKEGLEGGSPVWNGLSVQWNKEVAARAIHGYRMFFIHVLPVAPNKFRPPSVVGGQMFEHSQNVSLQRALNCCIELTNISATAATPEQLENVMQPEQVKLQELGRFVNQWLQLQDAVCTLMDSTTTENKSTDNVQGIRQALEKKEGLFRKNIMGKRVNFAARSVISPDVYIGTGEIGVPPYFAKRLCFPERVTPWNVERLRQAVIRGPHELPGAVAVEDERGRVVQLDRLDRHKREGLAKALLSTTASGGASKAPTGAAGSSATTTAPNKIVYRHLQDGDLMLTNRQPTLHKPSLMAHRARVLKGEKTIRMHYANCSTFNADFDGDEINLHLPQDQLGRAEGYTIVHADHQFIVPTDGKPIRGLIQDHVVSGVLLTRRDTWLTREEYSQLVYIACHAWARPGAGPHQDSPPDVILEPPTIVKPRMLWSGKQVVSTVVTHYTRGLPPLTFSAPGKVPPDYWGKSSGEADLVFHKGYIVAGCVDKGVFGKFGLVHAVQEMYGGEVAGKLLSSFSRLFTGYLQWYGFTCGFDDLLLTGKSEQARKNLLSRAEAIAICASADFVGTPLPAEWASTPEGVEQYKGKLYAAEPQVREALSERYRSSRDTGKAHDMKGSGVMHPLSSDVVKACLPSGQIKAFPKNCLSLMTVSGAKGSLVNFSQISCLLGQQELEGRRVPRMASGKTLPCFAAYDAGARSCGFVGDRFLSGLRPQEYYFHCMAGREGLIDTTVKTSRSGYLQRCLVKNLETLRIQYDGTVRDNADGAVVQFYYGDDGLDVMQVSYMAQIGFLAKNAPRFEQVVNPKDARHAAKVAHLSHMEAEVASSLSERAGVLAKLSKALKEGDRKREGKAKAALNSQLPLLATYSPAVLGATSEAFGDRLLNYLADNPDGLLRAATEDGKEGKKSKKSSGKGDEAAAALEDRKAVSEAKKVDPAHFAELMRLKYMRALAAPGEAVGVLAAQSVGEPSTQMTLNTFHMAGRGEANVTLGIPRLREILMTAAHRIKTPVMTLPLNPGLTATDAAVLAGRMRRLRLAECLAGISLKETPCARLPATGGYGRQYRVTLKFFSPEQYPRESGVTWEDLVDVFKGPFVARLKTDVDKEVKKRGGSAATAALRIGRVDASALGDEGAPAARGGGADDEDGDGEAGGSSRGRAKRGRAKEDDVEEGQDLPDDDPDDEAEEDEAMVEGKERARGSARDETAYTAADEEDAQVMSEAQRAAARRNLAVNPLEDDSDDDDEDDNEDENRRTSGAADANAREVEEMFAAAAKGKKGSKKAAGDAGVAGPAYTAAQAAAQLNRGLAGLSDASDGINELDHTCSVTISLPLHAPKLLMLEVVEKVAAAVMVQETQGIEKVYVLAGDRGNEGPRVQTDGINFVGVWAHADLVDVNKITCNDVAAMLRTYGVEAARATILREVSSVFGAYGIGVDPRHLGLIADFMTHQGGYRACSRLGIESSISPFLKMSYETAAHFLTDATLRSSADDLRTPSARLCVGRVVELGTGVMNLHQHLPKKGGAAPKATPKAPLLKAPQSGKTPGAGSSGGHDRKATKQQQQQQAPKQEAVMGDENHPIVIKADAEEHKEQGTKPAKTPKPRKQR